MSIYIAWVENLLNHLVLDIHLKGSSREILWMWAKVSVNMTSIDSLDLWRAQKLTLSQIKKVKSNIYLASVKITILFRLPTLSNYN